MFGEVHGADSPHPGTQKQSGQAAAGSARSIWVRYKCRLGEGAGHGGGGGSGPGPGACNWVES